MIRQFDGHGLVPSIVIFMRKKARKNWLSGRTDGEIRSIVIRQSTASTPLELKKKGTRADLNSRSSFLEEERLCFTAKLLARLLQGSDG